MIKIPFSSYDSDNPRSYLTAVAQLRVKLLKEKADAENKLEEFRQKLTEERSQISEILGTNFETKLNVNFCRNDEVKAYGHTENADVSSSNEGVEFEKCMEDCRRLTFVWSYLLRLKRVEKLSDELDERVKRSDWTAASIVYEDLRDVSRSLKTSGCVRLKNFVKTTKARWKVFLLRLLRETVAKILDEHGVPRTDLIKNVASLKSSLSEMAKFAFSLNSNFDNFTEALLTPFRLRFVYHFSDPASKIAASIGESKNLKPEWYLSLILKWQRKFLPLLTDLNDLPGENRQIFVDFGRGLVSLARERLKFDLNFVAENEKVLPHLIDEAIAFDLELRGLKYPETDLGCIELLTEPCIFEAWLDLEHQQCTKCVESLLADPSAWCLRYSEASDLDRFKVPRCTDGFLSLLTAMTQRYRLLRSRQHRLRFVHLQRTLIDDFRMHLFLLTRSSVTPWTTPFPQIVNATGYAKLVLSQWQESPTFVDLEPGVFDELIDLFEHFRRQMLSDAREAAAEETKPSLVRYRNEFTGRGVADNALASVLVPVQARLLEVRDLLSEANFRDWLRLFAESLEKLIIELVVFEIRADAKAGEELKDQLARALPKLFHAFGLSDGVYFQKLSQCLTVYELNAAGCILLRETLKSESGDIVENVSLEMGLSLLSSREIEALLQRRSDIVAI